jgi:Na+-translocating ferredoxin:NAD+ oxidoreductase RnfG subunit
METIIAAVISATAAILVCVINSNNQSKKMIAEMDKHNDLQAYQIQELTKQVEKHNKVIERVYALEQEDAVEKEEIKVINHRIKDLEGYHKP